MVVGPNDPFFQNIGKYWIGTEGKSVTIRLGPDRQIVDQYRDPKRHRTRPPPPMGFLSK